MSKVLVTGATGFIGGHLVDSLIARDQEVICLTRPTSPAGRLNDLNVRQVRCDLSDADDLAAALENVDVVYHVAGAIAALSNEDRQRVNVQGTRSLAQACAAQANPPTLLYVSSIAAAGPSTNGQPICESDACRPVSNYGQTKRAAELAAAEVAGRVPLTIVRPPAVFGERDVNSRSMFRPIKVFGTNFIPGWRHRRRYSFIHVADLVEAIVLAAENGKRVNPADARAEGFQQGCYFAADAECLTYGQFGRLIGDALGRRRVMKLGAPDSWMKVLGCLCDARSRLRRKPYILSRDKVREITAGSWTCCPQLAQDELGFKPAATLADRVKQTTNWMAKEGWL